MKGTQATEFLRKLFTCGVRVEAVAKPGREEFIASCCNDGELRITHRCSTINGLGGPMESHYLVKGLDDSIIDWEFPDVLQRAMTWVSILYATGNMSDIKEFEHLLKDLEAEPIVAQAEIEVLLKNEFQPCSCGSKPVFSVFANDTTYKIRCPNCGLETLRGPNRSMVESEWNAIVHDSLVPKNEI